MIATFGNFLYALYTLDYFLESMERFEIQSIELWGAAPHFHLEDRKANEAKELGKRLHERGLKVVCFTPEQCSYPINIASEDEIMRQRSINFFEKAIQYAPLLGSPAVLITPGQGSRNLPAKNAWQRSQQSMAYLAGRARKEGVALYLEHLTRTTSNVIVTMQNMACFLNELSESNVFPVADIDMMARENERLSDFETALGCMPAHVHMVDGLPGGHLVPGDGVLNLEKEFKWLHDKGYTGAFTFEVIHERYLIEPNEAVKKCLDWLKKASKKLGEGM
jgi:protein FrlC